MLSNHYLIAFVINRYDNTNMARPRSAHTRLVKAKLVARLRDGFHAPGQRFFSNRAIADQFGVSYQTAHRLVAELQAEGWLDRRAASGTYVAGPARRLRGAELFFHPRAQRTGSFGARLRGELTAALSAAGVACRTTWATKGSVPRPEWLPVIWECPDAVRGVAESRRYVVLLNDRPPPGLAANYVDGVATDDYSGGAAAAELLRRMAPPRQLAVLAGPRADERSQQRVAGFRLHAPKARVLWSPTWFVEDALRVAPRVMAAAPAGVFCANDRLAEALLRVCTDAAIDAPAVVGFDDAPVAETLHLTTIAIPWRELVTAAVELIQSRLGGATGATSQLIFAPRPVIRATAGGASGPTG